MARAASPSMAAGLKMRILLAGTRAPGCSPWQIQAQAPTAASFSLPQPKQVGVESVIIIIISFAAGHAKKNAIASTTDGWSLIVINARVVGR